MATETIQWRIVYRTHNEMEAQVIVGRLESEGINARMHQEPAGRAYGISVGLLGSVTVLVRQKDYKRALELLALAENNGAER